MAGFSDYLEDKLLNFVFKGDVFKIPGRYLALFTSDTGLEENNISLAAEVRDTQQSYARINITAQGGFNTASGGIIANSQDMDFPIAQADWGTITHTAVMDAATNGNVLAWGPLLNPRTIYNGDSVRVPSGALTITLS